MTTLPEIDVDPLPRGALPIYDFSQGVVYGGAPLFSEDGWQAVSTRTKVPLTLGYLPGGLMIEKGVAYFKKVYGTNPTHVIVPERNNVTGILIYRK